jgi:hypothetical protein
MKRSLFIVLALSLILLSCQRVVPSGEFSQLKGYWEAPQYTDSLVTYSSCSSLPDNDYGFAFMEEGVFLERKNAGSCGTPPITYADYEGTWSISDSLISISVPYWGGSIQYSWKLVSVNQNELKIIWIFSE